MCKIHWSFPRPHPEHMIFNWIHGNIHTASYRLQLALSVELCLAGAQGSCAGVGWGGMCLSRARHTEPARVRDVRDVALPVAPGMAGRALLSPRCVAVAVRLCQADFQLPQPLLLLVQAFHSCRSSASRIVSVAHNPFSAHSMEMEQGVSRSIETGACPVFSMVAL